MTATDWIQLGVSIVLTLTLVAILWYAWEARKAANASVKMAGIMLNSELNDAAPVIKLEVSGAPIIKIKWKNVGRGPALNFECWIEDEEYPKLRHLHKAITRTAIGVGDGDSSGIDTQIPNYKLENSTGYVRAQYDCIFEQRYESSLHVTPGVAPELKYGKATEKIIV